MPNVLNLVAPCTLKHLKTEGLYTFLGYAMKESLPTLRDAVYRSNETGNTWHRPDYEMHDERWEIVETLVPQTLLPTLSIIETREYNIARREAASVESWDAYVKARGPQYLWPAPEHIFNAGFERGWIAREEQRNA